MNVVDTYRLALTETLSAFGSQLETFIYETVKDIKNEFSIWDSPIAPHFTSLQWTLLKVLLILLLFTGILIAYFWEIYGEVISYKFVRPSTLKEIEELKLSVAKLKLPKEHSPRI